MGSCVASQAGFVYLLRTGCGQIEDLCFVSTRFDVSLASAMAALASNAFAAMLQRQLGVRIVGEFLGDFSVASIAGFGTYKVLRVGWRGFGVSGGWLGSLCCGRIDVECAGPERDCKNDST